MKIKLLLCGISSLLVGCDMGQTVYKGRYKNQLVKVNYKKTFASTNIDYTLRLGDLNPVPIDAHTIDLYGRPYSYAIFKNIPYRLIGPDTIAYKNKIGNNDIHISMLYIDPKQHDRKSYEAYADFFVHQWPQTELELRKLTNIYFDMRIIGVAYTPQDAVVQYFRGKENGQDYYFDISPDGAILYHSGTPETSDFNLLNSGLAEKIEMPGKIVRITDTTDFNKSRLREFKDLHGKSMEDYFEIKTGQ